MENKTHWTEDSHFIKGSFLWTNRRASWERYGNAGHAQLEYEGHKNAKWFQLNVTERGMKSTKEVMINLKKEEAINLAKAMLKIMGVSDSLLEKLG